LADISPETLYAYQRLHPEYTERKEQLKSMIKLQAKRVIKKAINEGDKQQANWYLERKGKDEGFSPRTEVTQADGKEFPTPILATAYVSNNDSSKEDNEPNKENKSSTGGNVSEQNNLNPSVLDTLKSE
jgi:hypothetical protein